MLVLVLVTDDVHTCICVVAELRTRAGMNPCNVQEIYKCLQVGVDGHTYKHRPTKIHKSSQGQFLACLCALFLLSILNPQAHCLHVSGTDTVHSFHNQFQTW